MWGKNSLTEGHHGQRASARSLCQVTLKRGACYVQSGAEHT